MITIFADQDGRPVGHELLLPHAPGRVHTGSHDGARAFTFDDTTNPVLAAIVNSGDVEHVRVTDDGVTWRGVPVPVQDVSDETKRATELDAAVTSVFRDEKMKVGDLVAVVRELCRRVGLMPSV